MSRKWINVLLLLAAFNSLHAVKNGSILQNGVPVYEDENQEKVLGYLDLGAQVRIQKPKGSLFYISKNDLKGWISASRVTVSSDLFSNVDNPVILCPRIIQDNEQAYLYFYTKENIIKYDIYNRKKVSAYKSGFINNIYAYGRGNQLLVEGIFTNSSVIQNLRILHLDNGQYIDLFSYNNKKALFLNGEFSEDGQYIALQFQAAGNSHVAVYKCDNGQYVGTAKNASKSFWQGHTVIFQDGNSLWNVDLDTVNHPDLSFKDDRTIIKLSTSEIPRDGMESAYQDGVIYYETRSGITGYDLIKKEKVKTGLKSLEFDPAFQLNHVENGDSHKLIALSSGNSYSYFSGTKPRYKFLQFLDGFLIYSRQVEKLDTLFICPVNNPYDDNAYKYKAIDEIDAYSDNGILAQITHDKDLSAILVEIPQLKNFFVILLKH